jgi:TonB family protein
MLFSQSIDTLYYNKDWDECSKELAFYYGIKELDSSHSGIENYYYLAGEKHSRKEIMNGSQHGNAIWWYKNGQKWCEGTYNKGIKEGLFTYWYPNGNKEEEGYYENDKRKENWKYFDKTGKRLFSYNKVDKPPLFMNAKKGKKSIKLLLKYLQQNTNYPDIGKEKGIEGKVIVGFTINEIGSVIDVVIIDGINYYLDEEAKRIIESLPKWKPAFQNGENVRVRFNIPINFKLK